MYQGYQDIKPKILLQLRHGPLGLVELAEELGQAQFLVRAELKSLQRDRLVVDKFEHAGQQVHVFELTDRGIKRVNASDQLEIDLARGNC